MNVFNVDLDEALFNLIWLQSYLCFELKFELKTFWGLFQPEFSYDTIGFVEEVSYFYLKSSSFLFCPYSTCLSQFII